MAASPDGKYWIGPFGIFVPVAIKSVASEDRVNRLYRMFVDGKYVLASTHILPNEENYTEAEYKSKYAIQRDGAWYYGAP